MSEFGIREGWLVISKGDTAHVLPCDANGFVVRGHKPTLTCPACRPVPVREDGPLGPTVWSHQQPGWPGATQGLS